jgi:murein DD-endopeptidase MepM/ murein hydrolase activator NlpD
MPVLGFPPERLVRSFDRVSRPPRVVGRRSAVARKAKRARSTPRAARGGREKPATRATRATRVKRKAGRRRDVAVAAADRLAPPPPPPGRHEAIDIPAPRYTPVVAVDDGTVAKLFYSRLGGITLYHFDPDQTLVYYYAHLETYAEGIKEGDRLVRGQVIGYVGTSGNAPPHAPHLHFAVHRLTSEKLWYRGTPIDPYDLLR